MSERYRARPRPTIPPAVIFSGAAGVLTLALGLYARQARPSILDVPLFDAGARLYYVLALLAVAGLGWQIHRAYDRPATRYTPYPPVATAWILSALTLLAAALLVARYHTAPIVVMAAVLATTGTFAALSIREVIADAESASQPVLLIHVVLTIVVTYVVVALLLQYQARLLFTAPAVFVVATLALLQIHDGILTYPVRRQAYALVGGVIAIEVVWPLSYWPPLGWWTGSVVLSVLTGYALVTRANLLRRLTATAAMQYAGLTAALLVFVVVLSRQ